jgi:uncharacterized protein
LDRSQPAPVPPRDRSLTIDILRAIAIFGIVVANVRDFTWVVPPGSVVRVEDAYPGALDAAAVWTTRMLFIGKFNALFSFLFGLGFTLQMARIEGAGGSGHRIYLRRLGVLFALGLLHFVFLWAGDILIVYSLMGLVLLAARPLPDRALLGLALASMVLAAMIPWMDRALTPETTRVLVEASRAAEDREAQATFAHGSFAGVTCLRARALFDVFTRLSAPNGIVHGGFRVTATALLGVIAGRRGFFVTRAPTPRSLGRALVATGAVGLLLAAAWTMRRSSPAFARHSLPLAVLFELQRPLLMTTYVGAVALFLEWPRARRALTALAPVGRTPLTNYLGQSAVMTTLFYGYGAGHYGKLGPAEGVLVACAIYAVQVMSSAVWLRRFEQGPVEWLWRRLTYDWPRAAAPAS